jgi:hypothetical protein
MRAHDPAVRAVKGFCPACGATPLYLSVGGELRCLAEFCSAHVTSIHVDAEANSFTRAMVVLEPVTLRAHPGNLTLTTEIHAALVALGWTPPAADLQPRRGHRGPGRPTPL